MERESSKKVRLAKDGLVSLVGADDFHELHPLYGIKEVESAHLSRSVGEGCHLGDRERRCVRRDHALVGDERADARVQGLLEREVFDDCFDEQVAARELVEAGGGVDAVEGGGDVGCALFLAQLALLHSLVVHLAHAVLDAHHASVEELGLELDGDDVEALLGGGLGDPVAHQPEADHTHAMRCGHALRWRPHRMREPRETAHFDYSFRMFSPARSPPTKGGTK